MRTHSDLVALALNVLRLNQQATPGPWNVKHDWDEKASHKVTASRPWRRLPVKGKKGAKTSLADVATISGGQLSEARSNAEFIATARATLPELADGYLALSRMLNLADNDKVPPSNAQAPNVHLELLEETGGYVTAAVVMRFLKDIQDAIDRMFGELGLPVSDPNDPLRARLTSGNHDGLMLKADLIRSLADIISPYWIWEKTRVGKQDWADRERARPKLPDFYKNLPLPIRQKLKELHAKAMFDELTEGGTKLPAPEPAPAPPVLVDQLPVES